MKKDRTPSDKNKYYWMWREEKKKVEELEAELTRAKDDHQFDNIVHQQELESLRKK